MTMLKAVCVCVCVIHQLPDPKQLFKKTRRSRSRLSTAAEWRARLQSRWLSAGRGRAGILSVSPWTCSAAARFRTWHAELKHRFLQSEILKNASRPSGEFANARRHKEGN